MLTEQQRETSPPTGGKPARIAIVEDAGSARAEEPGALRSILEAAGWAVFSLSMGRGMRRALAAHRPQVLLLDVAECAMVLRRLQRRLRVSRRLHSVPVIVVADRSTSRQRARALAEGAADFVTRPCDRLELLARIRVARRVYGQKMRAEDACREVRDLERRREDLLQMVAHDMGSPLFVIHCSLEMMLTSDSLSEEKRTRMLGSVLQSARSLGGMLSDLRDVRRFTCGEMVLNPDDHDVGDLARQAMENVGAGSVEPDVVLDMPGSTVPVQCDGPLIQRVLENLLARAIKSSPRDGRVTLRILPCSTGPLVRISDMGAALPRELHTKMFERFGQVDLHREGKKCSSALGLAFCKLAVDAHGGRIGVESEEDKGNTIWFTIPA